MSTESSLRADIVEVGRRMYARGYTASNDGNISVRLDAARLLMTPKSVCKGFMTPDMMCITDLEGRKLQGDRDPSSETLMHLEVYRQRPDVNAVVHAHPPTATGFAVAGIPLDSRRPGGGVDDARQRADRRVRHALDQRAARSGPQIHQGARRDAAGQPRRADGRQRSVRRVLQDGDDRALRARSASWRVTLGRENVLSREEVTRLQGLRGRTASKRRRRFAPTPRKVRAPGCRLRRAGVQQTRLR